MQKCGNDEQKRLAFIQAAIREHTGSEDYIFAGIAQQYYNCENPTINNYVKILYDAQGNAHRNIFQANHRLASPFFQFDVDQACSYLLGNGITLKPETLKKLGKTFWRKTWEALKNAQIGGVAFGFWNVNHLEMFRLKEFRPLYDEKTGALAAGVRFWQIDAAKPLYVTLYEPEGYTELEQDNETSLHVTQERMAYKTTVLVRRDMGSEVVGQDNYPGLPIVPLRNTEDCKSELWGKRATIDALDLAYSNMVNGVADGNILYWSLINCGGMSEQDAARFIDEIITTHVARMPNADEGATAEPHVIESPYQGTQVAIDAVEKKCYQDFQAFDASAVTAGNQTATAIKASYVPLDLKVDRMETNLTDFVSGILELAGVDDKPTFTRNKIINTQEEMQTLMLAAPYADDEYTTTKALTIMGDSDKVEEVLKRRTAEDLGRFDGNGEDGDTPDTDEAIDAAEEATGKTLNGSQTSSLITVIRKLGSGEITEGQAVKILTTAIGVTREEALAIIRGEE